jgi:hypothetical protein
MGQRAGQPLSGILRKSVGLPPATARGASIRKNKLAADGSNPGMEDILPQTSASLADCPIAGLFGRDPDHGHDMRPALRTWLCMWDAETIDSLGAAGDLAVLLVLLDGGPLHLWLGDAMRREQVVLPGGVAASASARFCPHIPAGLPVGERCCVQRLAEHAGHPAL